MLANRLRIAADPEKVATGILNAAKDGKPCFWRGSELRVEFAVFDGAALDDIANIADVTCRVKDSQTGTTLLMEKTVYDSDLDPDTTLDTWKAETAQHGAFVFSGEETNLVMDKAYVEVWMVIVATLTDGQPLVLAAGKVTCHDANFEAGDTPPEYPPAVTLAGPRGYKGWSPVLAVASDGARRVLQVSDWTGGEGTKPAAGQYLGVSGLVTDIADGVDIRGVSITGITGLSYDATRGGMVVATTDGSKFVPLNDMPS